MDRGSIVINTIGCAFVMLIGYPSLVWSLYTTACGEDWRGPFLLITFGAWPLGATYGLCRCKAEWNRLQHEH